MSTDLVPADEPLDGRILDDDWDETVLEATNAALRKLQLPERCRGMVAVIRRLAAQIDVMGPTGLTPDGKLDNVSIPTYLRTAEALGMTLPKPSATSKPAGAKPQPSESPMGDERASITSLQGRIRKSG